MNKNIPKGIILIAAINFLIACGCLWLFFYSYDSSYDSIYDLILPPDGTGIYVLLAPILFTGAVGILFLKNWARKLVMVTSFLPIPGILFVAFYFAALPCIGPTGCTYRIESFINPAFLGGFFVFLVISIIILIPCVKIIKYLCKLEIKNSFT